MQQDDKNNGGRMVSYLPIGIGIGVAFGAILGNIGVGMAFGAAIGVTWALLAEQKARRRE